MSLTGIEKGDIVRLRPIRIKIGNKEFLLRPAKKSDLSDIVKMSKGVNEIENYPGQKMKAEDFVHFVGGDGPLMLVAESTGRKNRHSREVVGYITVYQSENYFYLPYAVTKQKWRKCGVGGALLERVEALAKDAHVEYILMSVYVYNTSVHSFLRERGYVASKKLVQYSKLISGKKSK